ncbi:gamma-tubulin complex component [Achlya hypogyna]|uniref:Gamma-tubulin complex component n=1 Tax=Achlya hypogyna TaxID=1202772 RepID=A0A1V9ZKY5_ACHHY|nr:gamma-tubulin complex component [Achlya hypogyna]
MDPGDPNKPRLRAKPKLTLNMPQLPPRRTAGNSIPAPALLSTPAVTGVTEAPASLYQTPARTMPATADTRTSGVTSHFKKPPLTTRASDSDSRYQATPPPSTTFGITDPLTPSSRLNLDSRGSSTSSHASTSFRESRTATFPPAHAPQEPLSPNSMLLNTLDAVSQMTVSAKPSVFSYESSSRASSGLGSSSYSMSSASVATTKTRTTTFHMTSTSTTSGGTTHVGRLGVGDHGQGGDIYFLQTRVRIRAGNIYCLRCRTEPSSKTGLLVSAVDAGGAGFDQDEIFVFVNATLRSDEGRVKFTDVVSLYCIAGASKGRFLSVDGTRLTTKKGPMMTSSEKWRLLEKDEMRSSRPVDDEADAFLAPGVRNAQRPLQSGDRIVLQLQAQPYVLSVENRTEVVLHDTKDATGFEVWEVTKANIPYDPPWNRDRVFLTGAFVLEGKGDEAPPLQPLTQWPASLQERALVDDLLYVLLGIEGRYIRRQEVSKLGTGGGSYLKGPSYGLTAQPYRDAASEIMEDFAFAVDAAVTDASLAALAAKVVVLGEYYLHVTTYVETHRRYEYGQVCHAFCAGLKVLLREYTVVVAQLENLAFDGGLSLSKLWFYVQPSLRAMELLSTLVRSVLAKQGGALLSGIAQLPTSGDAKAAAVLHFLLEKASVPYLQMLELWIYHGELKDPYDEFMVAADDTLQKEEVSDDPWSKYWERRYTLRETHVPSFLARVAEKVLTTGKYLNVFRTCGRRVNCPFADTIPHAESARRFDELVDKAHAYASALLVDLLVDEHDLMNRLRSIKHYFLMDQGDFFVDFMDAAEPELNLRADQLLASRLESLLHLSLQTSTCASDPYKDDLICVLSPQNLISQMEAIHERSQKVGRAPLSSSAASSFSDPGYKAIDALSLDYKVKWPLSLVISSGALNKYQMIFRHLFFCKHVERRLCDAWRNHQTTKELGLRSALIKSYCLRQRMLHFQQNFVYYMMFEVISPRWHALEAHLTRDIGSVDDVLNTHRDFLDQCLKECLLTDPELLRVLTKLMTVCLTFANSIDRFTRPYCLDEEAIRSEREAERDRRADKKAREEADLMMSAKGKTRKSSAVPKRFASNVDVRRQRIKDLADDVRRALTETEMGENPFVRMTDELELQFDTLLAEFMQALLHRSHLQFNSHLSNLCTRLDYNGFYTNAA